MSPVIGRRSLTSSPAILRRCSSHANNHRAEDESHLLAQSPVDLEANPITNGNSDQSSSTTAPQPQATRQPEIAFCLPHKFKTPVSQVRVVNIHVFI